MKSPVLLWAVAAFALGAGCAGGDDDDSGNDSPVDATEQPVRCPDNIPEFFASETTGMEAMGENMEIKARLIEAEHVPPQRFSNTWTIELMKADGTPLEDAEIIKACAFMPVHGHGLPPKNVEDLGQGRFLLDRLNFSMRGPWEIQLSVDSASVPEATARATNCDTQQGTDYLAFSICVADE